MATTVVGPTVPLVVQTTVPGTETEQAYALAVGGSLDKAERAIEEAADQIKKFLLALKRDVFEDTGADEVTLHCELSVTAGVNLGVQLSGTGDVAVELTWKK